MKTGERLKELRELAGLSQGRLARYVDLDERSIRRYERGQGRPGATALARLSCFFDVQADYLLGLGGPAAEDEVKSRLFSESRRGLYARFVHARYGERPRPDAAYYWIFSYDDRCGACTAHVGETPDGSEIREPAAVDPERTAALCTAFFRRPFIINRRDEVEAFIAFGGEALIRRDICEACLPDMTAPYIGAAADEEHMRVLRDIPDLVLTGR